MTLVVNGMAPKQNRKDRISGTYCLEPHRKLVDARAKRQQMMGREMAISAADEKTFILSDKIIDHLYSLFPLTNDHADKTNHAYAALQALINVIGTVLSEIECPDCWKLTTKALERSFAQMLEEVPSIRAELEREQRAHSTH